MAETYVLLEAGGLDFLIPMEQVRRVLSLQEAKSMGIPLFSLEALWHEGEDREKEYVLLLEVNGLKAGLMAGRVDDLVQTEEADFLLLDPLVRQESNSYLEGICLLDRKDCPPAYRVSVEKLFKRAEKYLVQERKGKEDG